MTDDTPEEQVKLSRSTLRKINKVATGPLLGGVTPAPRKATTAMLVSRVAPLGNILAVRARMAQALEGNNQPH